MNDDLTVPGAENPLIPGSPKSEPILIDQKNELIPGLAADVANKKSDEPEGNKLIPGYEPDTSGMGRLGDGIYYQHNGNFTEVTVKNGTWAGVYNIEQRTTDMERLLSPAGGDYLRELINNGIIKARV
ncbi:hypothetical protein ACFL6K_01275 [Candidatus Latescibacterota bacterium]